MASNNGDDRPGWPLPGPKENSREIPPLPGLPPGWTPPTKPPPNKSLPPVPVPPQTLAVPPSFEPSSPPPQRESFSHLLLPSLDGQPPHVLLRSPDGQPSHVQDPEKRHGRYFGEHEMALENYDHSGNPNKTEPSSIGHISVETGQGSESQHRQESKPNEPKSVFESYDDGALNKLAKSGRDLASRVSQLLRRGNKNPPDNENKPKV